MRSRPSTLKRKLRKQRVENLHHHPASAGSWGITLYSLRDTQRLGHAIGQSLAGGETLALIGPLGAGKTTLVRAIAGGVGATPDAVSSPTFVFIHEYRGRLPLAHVDLYRVNSVREVESTGLKDYLIGSTVAVIEWADRGISVLPPDHLEMELRHRSVGSRRIRMSATGPLSDALLIRIQQQFARAARLRAPKRTTRPKPKGKTS